MPEAHVMLVTHTPERLARTLLALSCQTRAPDSVTLSCDTDDPEIEREARRISEELGLKVTLVQRAHTGVSRSGQARNNAVRALLEHEPADDSVLIFLDADCAPEPSLTQKYLEACGRRSLVHGGRIEMTEDQTRDFDEDALRRAELPIAPTPDQLHSVARRHARYRRHAALRGVGLAKHHKPKLISANFAVRLHVFRQVNGFDETFEGWGQEDDDLGRRIYMAGGRPVVRVRDILAFHQHHHTRAPGEWSESANASRLDEPCVVRCPRGLDSPIDQPTLRVTRLEPAGSMTGVGA